MNPFLFSFQSLSPYQHLLHAGPCKFTCILNTAASSPVFAGSFWYTYILAYYFLQLIIMNKVRPLGTLALALTKALSVLQLFPRWGYPLLCLLSSHSGSLSLLPPVGSVTDDLAQPVGEYGVLYSDHDDYSPRCQSYATYIHLFYYLYYRYS